MHLKDRDWRALLLLNGELAEIASADPLAGVDHLLESLYRLTGADEGFVMVTRRGPTLPADDPLAGWRPASSIYNRRSAERARIAADWYSEPSRLTADIVAQRLMQSAGRTRVVRRAQVADTLGSDEAMIDPPLMAELDVRHRLTGATPVGPRCEVVLGLDRRRGSDFGDSEQAIVETALSSLTWFFRRLPGAATSRPGPPLSAREAETLEGLLGGRSEKALARDMGLSTGTLHQYVKSVYRKMGVHSRPELMARFIPSPHRPPGAPPAALSPAPAARHVVDHPDASPRADFLALQKNSGRI